MKGILAVLVFASAALGALLSGSLLTRHVVDDRSMLRAYRPGDRLLVERLTSRLRRPAVGDVVVVRRRGAGGRLDLKRIAASEGMSVSAAGESRALGRDEWFLLGDNMDESTDSRHLGPVKTSDIVGRVWRKY